MTCIRMGNAIVCVNDWGRLKVGNKYIWVEIHSYCGPTFYKDSRMEHLYDPVDENDPVWIAFKAWRNKKEKEACKLLKEKTGNQFVPHTVNLGP